MLHRMHVFVFLCIVCINCFDYYYYDPTICQNVQPGLWVSYVFILVILHLNYI